MLPFTIVTFGPDILVQLPVSPALRAMPFKLIVFAVFKHLSAPALACCGPELEVVVIKTVLSSSAHAFDIFQVNAYTKLGERPVTVA